MYLYVWGTPVRGGDASTPAITKIYGIYMAMVLAADEI